MTIPEGFHTVTPYLTTHRLDALLGFLENGLGATETFRARGGNGGVHVEVRIGDSMIMVGGLASPDATPMTAMLHLYVDDVDAWHARSLAAGAKSVMTPANTPDGARRAGVTDPVGNVWFFARRKDEPAADELAADEPAE